MLAGLVPDMSDKMSMERFTVCISLRAQKEQGNTGQTTAIRGFTTFCQTIWSPEGNCPMKRPVSQNISSLE